VLGEEAKIFLRTLASPFDVTVRLCVRVAAVWWERLTRRRWNEPPQKRRLSRLH
jgi:hypothetical protein